MAARALTPLIASRENATAQGRRRVVRPVRARRRRCWSPLADLVPGLTRAAEISRFAIATPARAKHFSAPAQPAPCRANVRMAWHAPTRFARRCRRRGRRVAAPMVAHHLDSRASLRRARRLAFARRMQMPVHRVPPPSARTIRPAMPRRCCASPTARRCSWWTGRRACQVSSARRRSAIQPESAPSKRRVTATSDATQFSSCWPLRLPSGGRHA